MPDSIVRNWNNYYVFNSVKFKYVTFCLIFFLTMKAGDLLIFRVRNVTVLTEFYSGRFLTESDRSLWMDERWPYLFTIHNKFPPKKTKGKTKFNVIFRSELLKFISRLEFAKPLLAIYIYIFLIPHRSRGFVIYN